MIQKSEKCLGPYRVTTIEVNSLCVKKLTCITALGSVEESIQFNIYLFKQKYVQNIHADIEGNTELT